jgi:hypothetical protein
MQDAVAVTLERGPIFGFVVEIGAALGVLAAGAIGRKTFILDLLKLLAGKEHTDCLSDANVSVRSITAKQSMERGDCRAAIASTGSFARYACL